MNPEHLPNDDSLQPVKSPPDIKQSFWKSRFLLIATLIIVLAIAAGILTAIALHNKQPKRTTTAQTTKSVSHQTFSSTTPATVNNIWKGSIDPTAIPLGDGKVSTSPKVGYVDSCITNFKGGGAMHAGSWLNSAGGTWNSQTKLSVQGSVNWPNASYSATTSSNSRIISTNDLPDGYPTGNFPISPSDPAYQYDRNPNHIAAQNTTYTLPLNPVAAGTPQCVGLGPIGVLSDGVFLYDALDASGRDAGAHEIQDSCSGHPDGNDRYHYHSISACIMKSATGSSTLVGYALDGYGIYVERDAQGNLPTNADLDVCHGRTSPVMWNGKMTDIYHYDATIEYPYTVGCYHGTPVSTRA